MLSLDIVIPVYNEEHVLAGSIATLEAFLTEHMRGYEWTITVADNASRDGTLAVARELSHERPKVGYIHLDQKGRGRALRAAWSRSSADLLAYMDVDLSSGLESFPDLIRSVAGGYDIAIGSRLHPESDIVRSLKREVLSRGYNIILKSAFSAPISDAQCGFKAITRACARSLIPLVQNQEWFFDTELLMLAAQKGYRIKEVPVRWVEDPDTRVNIPRTMIEDLRGVLRLLVTPTP
ncbi:MAG: glycosyltransferase family 2 protein [Dehalococcoidia bacterium]|nr:glycosyltransferase family 2 protein [Dehalococcoidia bacterium]